MLAGSAGVEQRNMGTRPAAAILESFDGFGVGFEGPDGAPLLRNPSDSSLAVGPDHIVQTVNSVRGNAPVALEIPVLVTNPALGRLEIVPEHGALFVGTLLAHAASGAHEDGSKRLDLRVTWRSSDPSVAGGDRFGSVHTGRHDRRSRWTEDDRSCAGWHEPLCGECTGALHSDGADGECVCAHGRGREAARRAPSHHGHGSWHDQHDRDV